MRKWAFVLYDEKNKTTYKLKHDIDEWKSFGISYGREERAGIFKSYNAGFTFIKEDASFLKDIIISKGFNERIRLDVFVNSVQDGSQLIYSGYLDLTDPEMSGCKFKCPIYSGGFFTSLDNSWDTQYSIPNENTTQDKFKDIDFDGGTYALNQPLGLLLSTQTQGDTVISMPISKLHQTFLPIKRTDSDSSKLNFFQDAETLTILGNEEAVSEKNCFIVSPNRDNGGNLQFDLSSFVGRGVLKDIPVRPYQNDYVLSGTITLQFRFGVYLFDKTEAEIWRPSENQLRKEAQFTTNQIITAGAPDSFSDVHTDISFNNLHLMNFSVNLDWLTQTNRDSGYMVAVSMSCIMCAVEYIDHSKMEQRSIRITDAYVTNPKMLEFYPSTGFSIKYENRGFKLNRKKKIHGISPSDLFIKLLEKINTTVNSTVENSGVYSILGKYDLRADNDTLRKISDKYIIASGTTLIGNKLKLFNSIQSSVNTSLKDFTDFVYKVFNLKLIVLYDRDTDTYNLSWKKTEDCYKNDLIQEITEISNITVTSDRNRLYTAVKVGYKNNSNVIFGHLEYNTENLFKTQNTELESNELDLVSSYKAGALDVETFIHENNGNTEDTSEGGSDIYVIEIDGLKNAIYQIDRGNINRGINVSLSPKKILNAHLIEISSYLYKTDKLIFISSERNAEFEHLGISESSDFLLSQNIVTKPFIISVNIPAVNDIIKAIEANPLGYFSFKHNGATYKGFIADGTESITINPMNEQESTVTLIAHTDSHL